MEIPLESETTKLCFLFINCVLGRLFNISTNPRTVTLRPLDGAMSEEAWRIILSLSPRFLDPLFAAPVVFHSRLHQTEELRTAVVLFSLAEIVRAVVGSESSVVCSAFVLIFLSFFFFSSSFFFLLSVWSMEPSMKTTGGRKERRRASTLKKMAPLVCFECSSCM